MQIMEAQEFRDVAGQMVNKIVDAAVEIETILLELLKEYAPVKFSAWPATQGLLPVLKTVLPSALLQVAFQVVLEAKPSLLFPALATLCVVGP